MVLKNIFFILLVFYAFLQVHGQNDDDCAPDGVQLILFYANATLYWTMDPFQQCEVTSFQIYISGDEGQAYFFEVTEYYLDLSYLPICTEWSFTIIPISNGAIGLGITVTRSIPLPADADLSMRYFNATFLEDRDVFLEWDIANHTYGNCSLYYEISVTDDELNTTQDVYAWENSVNISSLSPCVSHQLRLRAINTVQPNIEGPWIAISFDMPAKPQIMPELSSIDDIGATSVNMTWTLEGTDNRCPLIALYFDGGSYLNISVPLQNSVDQESVMVNLQPLQSSSMYYFRVYVENTGGLSPAFPLAVQTLDITSS